MKDKLFFNLHFCFPLKSTPKIKGMSKKEGAKRKINMSGYILFSSEMRAVIKARHPDFSFGELSRLVGTEWRNLESTKKADYEGENKHLAGVGVRQSELKSRRQLFGSFQSVQPR